MSEQNKRATSESEVAGPAESVRDSARCMIGDPITKSGEPHVMSGHKLATPVMVAGETYGGVVTTMVVPGPEKPAKRTFESGATRDTDSEKLDYEAFLSPLVLQEFAKYMHAHRFMKDGTVRDGDNWQKGFPATVCEKSLNRHYMDFWIMDRKGVESYERPDSETVTKSDALMGILFNVQAIVLQRLNS